MMRLSSSYFERVYAENDDPWDFDTSWYEARKYAVTMAALGRQRYARAFEPGCSNGALTVRLAERCDELVSTDLVQAVVARARERVRSLSNVHVLELSVPDEWPGGRFDLIVVSELAYYLTDEGLTALIARIDASLQPDGEIVAVHWTGPTDFPLSGAHVHARFDAHDAWRSVTRHTEEAFVLGVYKGRTA